MKTFARAAFVAVFATSIVALPAHSIPNEDYKRTIQMVDGGDVVQFTLTPTPAEGARFVTTEGALVSPLEEPAVLTPTKLYDLIEVEQKKSRIQTRILAAFQDRLKVLEESVKELETKLQKTRDQVANIVRMQRAKGK